MTPAVANSALAAMAGQQAILEAFVRFEREVSVVAARGIDGAFAAFDVTENEHRDHILHRSIAPADVSATIAGRAIAATQTLAAALDYVGVMAVEFFVAGGQVLVNEIAPRVHNSGHWTSEGAETSQFHQHVRAVCGLPLGSARSRGRAIMHNLIGDEADGWAELLAEPGAHLHLYGKGEARPGRKMGHVTALLRGGEPKGQKCRRAHGQGRMILLGATLFPGRACARPGAGFTSKRHTGHPRAGSRSRQQRRSGSPGAQEEDAARGHFPRDEAAWPL